MGVTSLGGHTRPACHQALFAICWLKKKKSWFWPLYSVFFMDFWECEGSGATFNGLRMRSRSTRKCAHRNAGDLGSSLTVCACAYDPIHVTAQGKRLGPHSACVQPPRHYRGLPRPSVRFVKTGVTSLGRHTGPACCQALLSRLSLKLCEKCGSNSCVRVFFIPWGHVNFHDHIWALWRQMGHLTWMLDSDWSTKFVLRSDWSGPNGAIFTTLAVLHLSKNSEW